MKDARIRTHLLAMTLTLALLAALCLSAQAIVVNPLDQTTPQISHITASRTSAEVGSSVTWTTVMENEGAGTQKYYYIVHKDGAPIRYTGWIAASAYHYTLPSAGTFCVKVKVKDANGVISEIVASPSITAVSATIAPPEVSSVAASVANANINETVTWTPNVANEGAGGLKYYYIVHKDGAPIRYTGWIAASAYRYTLPSAGTFCVKVKVKDANGVISEIVASPSITAVSAAIAPPEVSSVAASVATAGIGGTVTWTPNVADEGAGALKYYYIVHKDGAPIRYTGWIAASAYRYTLPSAGTFCVKVKVKDANGVISEIVASPSTTAVSAAMAPPAISSVTASVANANINETVTWSPNVTSEGAGGLMFYYIVYKDGAPIRYTGWITASAYRYKLSSAGTYTVRVKVKDANDTVSAQVTSRNTVVTAVKPSISLISCSFSGGKLNYTITMSKEGAGGLMYYYTMYKDNEPIRYSGWLSNPTYSYTVSEVGIYCMKVKVKDAIGTVSNTVSSCYFNIY